MTLIRRLIHYFGASSRHYRAAEKESDDLKILIAKTLISAQNVRESIHEAEFRIFSQWGDDGIIQYLVNKIATTNNYFVEFGVENYTEANTRFLLMNNNWSGLVMDGSADNIDFIKKSDVYWKYDLIARHAFVTAENINELLALENVPPHIGLLHIDIDGNDYWIWKAIKHIKSDIVIVEYNSVFGSERAVTVPYQSNFQRSKMHYSNLYYGSSLMALCDLAKEKGYSFVGCNSSGNNAYFVLDEKMQHLKAVSAEAGFVSSKFKESRDTNGQLSFLRAGDRTLQIQGLDVFNTRTNQIEKF
jgi:hypothetical protein